MQTQVTGLNDKGVTVGFWSSMNNASQVNDNHGFYERNGKFHTADFPAGSPAAPPVDQLLGVNNNDVAVGFWTDANGVNHGYEYNIDKKHFSSVTYAGDPAVSLTAAGINNRATSSASTPARQREHRRVHQGPRHDVHRPGSSRRVVHDGARRQRPRRGRRRLHRRVGQQSRRCTASRGPLAAAS